MLAFAESIPAGPLDTWTVRSPISPVASLHAVTYASGQFVAVGGGNLVLSSADGASWVQRLGTNSVNFSNAPHAAVAIVSFGAVAYGNGQFVATGVIPGVVPIEAFSTDGTNWIEVLGGGTGASITSGNGLFVEALFGWTSIDGTNWAMAKSNALGWIEGHAVTFGNGRFVLVGSDQLGTHPATMTNIATSVDGTNWIQAASGTSSTLNGVVYGAGQFVAVGGNGDGSVIVTSADGTNWTQRLSESADDFLLGVAYGSGQFVAVGCTGALLTSTDGSNWVRRQSGISSGCLIAVAYGDGHFVAVHESGTIIESGSIITLALTPSMSSGRLLLSLTGPTGLAYTVQSSSDLIAWENVTNFTFALPTSEVLNLQPPGASHLFYRASAVGP
jgi:hypothetical protein